MTEHKINKKYKDRIFRMIFHEKKELLELYNAVNNSNYTNPDDLTITTIEDVVYMGMKNDLSFLIGDVMNLYEHQSSFSPNLPLRGLFYFFIPVQRVYRTGKAPPVYSIAAPYSLSKVCCFFTTEQRKNRSGRN